MRSILPRPLANSAKHMAQGEEKVLGEFQGVKHNKQDGVLIVTTARVAWSQEGQTFQVNLPYQQIKSQRISAETSSRVQLQLVLHSGSPLKFHFIESNALEQRNQVKDILSQQLAKQSLQVNPEIVAKTTMLNSDPALYQLYKDLVGSGLITAEEFWTNRFNEKNVTSVKGKKIGGSSDMQESGLPSAFLADVHAVSDGCNAVKYNLTADVIQAIFKTYPSVKLKHTELVPEKMTEEAFWTQFFQSQFFHHDSSSGRNLFSECLTQEQKSMLKSNSESGKRITLNTTETSKNTLGEEGYSVTSEAQQPPASSALPLLQRCNHHSNMVLKAILNDKEPTVLELNDLDSTPVSELKLTTSQQYHESSVPGSTLMSLAQELTTWTPQQVVDSAAAHSALNCLLPGGMLMSGGGYNQKGGRSLSQEQREVLFRHQAAIAELLRHFWSCFPIRTPQLEEKVHKMYRCLQEYQDSRLEELVTSLGGSDEHRVVAHLKHSIAMALEQYHSWQSKRKS